jgi:hypothetical protein
LRWLDDERLACPRVNLLTVFDERSQTLQSTPDEFVLMKSRGMIDWYESSFAKHPPQRILDIGIFKGGSVVLFSELWQPKRLVAVDISEPIPALTEYIHRFGLEETVRPLFGVDQSDIAALRSIISSEFEGSPLDLVVDDGCHFYQETRATFEAAFPFLGPGGIYVIEDWAWAHWPGTWQEGGGPWPDKPAPTLLVLELAMLCASRPDLVESVNVTPGLVVIRRGSDEISETDFELSSTYLTAGRAFLEAGFPSPVKRGRGSYWPWGRWAWKRALPTGGIRSLAASVKRRARALRF